MAVRKAIEQGQAFRGKWVLPALSTTITPPAFSRCFGARSRKPVKHREHRRRPDTSTEQYKRIVARSECEAASRRAYLKQVSHSNGVMKVAAPYASRSLHADAIRACTRRARHGIASQNWR